MFSRAGKAVEKKTRKTTQTYSSCCYLRFLPWLLLAMGTAASRTTNLHDHTTCWRDKPCLWALHFHLYFVIQLLLQNCCHVSDVPLLSPGSGAHLLVELLFCVWGSTRFWEGISGHTWVVPSLAVGDPDGPGPVRMHVHYHTPLSRCPKSITWRFYPPGKQGLQQACYRKHNLLLHAACCGRCYEKTLFTQCFASLSIQAMLWCFQIPCI